MLLHYFSIFGVLCARTRQFLSKVQMNNYIKNQGGSSCCRKKAQQGPEKVVVLGPGSTTYFGFGRFRPKDSIARDNTKGFGRRVHTAAANHTNTKANLMYRIQLRDGITIYKIL